MSPGSGPMEGHLCIYVCTHASCASALAGRTCRPLKNYRPVIFIKSESGSLTRSIRTSSTWSLFFKCFFAREKARLTYRRLCVFCFAFVYLNVWVDTVKKGCIFRRKRIRKKNDIFNFTFTSINMCLRWWFDLIIFFFLDLWWTIWKICRQREKKEEIMLEWTNIRNVWWIIDRWKLTSQLRTSAGKMIFV